MIGGGVVVVGLTRHQEVFANDNTPKFFASDTTRRPMVPCKNRLSLSGCTTNPLRNVQFVLFAFTSSSVWLRISPPVCTQQLLCRTASCGMTSMCTCCCSALSSRAGRSNRGTRTCFVNPFNGLSLQVRCPSSRASSVASINLLPM